MLRKIVLLRARGKRGVATFARDGSEYSRLPEEEAGGEVAEERPLCNVRPISNGRSCGVAE